MSYGLSCKFYADSHSQKWDFSKTFKKIAKFANTRYLNKDEISNCFFVKTHSRANEKRINSVCNIKCVYFLLSIHLSNSKRTDLSIC